MLKESFVGLVRLKLPLCLLFVLLNSISMPDLGASGSNLLFLVCILMFFGWILVKISRFKKKLILRSPLNHRFYYKYNFINKIKCLMREQISSLITGKNITNLKGNL